MMELFRLADGLFGGGDRTGGEWLLVAGVVVALVGLDGDFVETVVD